MSCGVDAQKRLVALVLFKLRRCRLNVWITPASFFLSLAILKLLD
jgi:hypothetical protein